MDKKQIAGDGMVTGYGKIDGRLVFVYAYDFTAHGGSLSETNAAKIVKVQELALKNGAPVIALNDSGRSCHPDTVPAFPAQQPQTRNSRRSEMADVHRAYSGRSRRQPDCSFLLL